MNHNAHNLNFVSRRVLAVAGGLAVAVPVLFSPVRAQVQPARALDVASVRPASFQSESYFIGFASAGACAGGARRPAISGNRFTLPKMTLCGLIAMAYDIQANRISGAPGWMMKVEQSNYYDVAVQAEGDGPLTDDQARGLLRALLADRFQLKLHRETRTVPVYELTIGKNGTKLKEVPLEGRPQRNGVPMATYIALISTYVDRSLVDKTGLTGMHYQYQWEDRELREQLTQVGKPAPSIFSAVQEQLGLSLKPASDGLDILVIDRAEQPSRN